MAITIISQPSAFSFSGNQIVFALQSDNFLAQQGKLFIGEITKDQPWLTGKQFVFQFGDELTTMTAVVSPDNSGTQFPSEDNLTIPIAVMAEYFKKNYTLNSNYDISVDGIYMVFTARETGSFYNFKPNPGLQVVRALGQDAKERLGFKFLFEVFLENEAGTRFDKVYSEKPNSDLPFTGKLTIDVHDIIDAALSLDLPDPRSAQPFKCRKSKRRFYTRFAELYGNPAQVMQVSQSAIYHLATGGLSYIGFLNKSAIDTLRPLEVDKRKDLFLKQGSRSIRTRKDQPQYLYFINFREPRLLYLQTVVNYTDGTTATQMVISIYLEQYEKVAFSCGYDQQQLALLQPDKTPASFTCSLVNAALEQLSEQVTFVVDTDYKEWIRYFLYSSSFGAFDSFVAYGKAKRDADLDQQTSERPKLIGYKVTDGTKASYALNYQRNFTINTGWLTQREFSLLTDFYISEDKFLYQSGKLMPISVTEKKIPEQKDGSTLISQEISCTLNFTDDKYTENDMEGSPIVLPPVTGLLRFGYSLNMPSSATAVKALPSSQPYEIKTFILNTGTNRFFSVAVPNSLMLHEAYDQTSEEDVTSEYLANVTSLTIDGVQYTIYTMEMAVSYSINQEHLITLVNV